MNLRRYLERRQKQVNSALEQLLPARSGHPERLFEAMRYSLFAGGKRIRPILLLGACEAVGGDVRAAMPFACAVELIHTYSLIHDDLPAMDDDAMRRGRPTCHRVFGEAMAILAGDALLTEAFRVMAAAAGNGISARRGLRAMREIAEGAGMHGMVAGQAADLEAEGRTPDLPTVEFIHVRKTGALILASVRAGAILGGARAGELRRLTRYGEFLGLVFQVADDILDAEGSLARTGKMPGGDARRKKATYPAVLGLRGAKERARDLVNEALLALEGLPKKAEPLREIARFVVARACSESVVWPGTGRSAGGHEGANGS